MVQEVLLYLLNSGNHPKFLLNKFLLKFLINNYCHVIYLSALCATGVPVRPVADLLTVHLLLRCRRPPPARLPLQRQRPDDLRALLPEQQRPHPGLVRLLLPYHHGPDVLLRDHLPLHQGQDQVQERHLRHAALPGGAVGGRRNRQGQV